MIKELDRWDWPDTREIREGYAWNTMPDFTVDNFILLVEKVNELIVAVNKLLPPDEPKEEV